MESQPTDKSTTAIFDPVFLQAAEKTGPPNLSVGQMLEVDSVREQKRRSQQTNRFFGYLQDLRVEVQNLRTSVLELESAYTSKNKKGDEATGTTCVVVPVDVQCKIFEDNKARIAELFRQIKEIIEECPHLHRDAGDAVTHIENLWQRFDGLCSDEFDCPSENIQGIAAACVKYLDEIVFRCGLITIPRRTQEHLKTLRAGYALDFKEVFQDELCSDDHVAKILDFIADHPSCVQGIVDKKQGRIYKVEAPEKQYLSYVRIGLLVFFGGVGLSIVLPLLAQTYSTRALLALYALVVVGAVVHLGVDALKEEKNTTSETDSILAVDEWLLWVHIKELLILKGCLIILIGFAVLILVVPDLSYLTAFAAGYSIDSLGDLFINKFESVMTAKGDVAKKAISPA